MQDRQWKMSEVGRYCWSGVVPELVEHGSRTHLVVPPGVRSSSHTGSILLPLFSTWWHHLFVTQHMLINADFLLHLAFRHGGTTHPCLAISKFTSWTAMAIGDLYDITWETRGLGQPVRYHFHVWLYARPTLACQLFLLLVCVHGPFFGRRGVGVGYEHTILVEYSTVNTCQHLKIPIRETMPEIRCFMFTPVGMDRWGEHSSPVLVGRGFRTSWVQILTYPGRVKAMT